MVTLVKTNLLEIQLWGKQEELLLQPWHPAWAPVGAPAAPLPTQLPANAPEMASDGSWLQAGPALGNVAMWAVEQQADGVSLSPLSFFIFLTLLLNE